MGAAYYVIIPQWVGKENFSMRDIKIVCNIMVINGGDLVFSRSYLSYQSGIQIKRTKINT